jgi:hypothetical protein
LLASDAPSPLALLPQLYEAGIGGAIFPPAFGGTPPEGYDAFHELILWDEARPSRAAWLQT